MTLQTLASIDLYSLTKRDLKALCKAIMNVDATRHIDLRSNCTAMIEFIEDYKLTLMPPLLAQLEVTTPKNEEITEVTEVEAPEYSVLKTEMVVSETSEPVFDHPILKAMDALLVDNPDLLSADGLSTLLQEYSFVCLDKKIEPKTYPSLRRPEVLLGLAGIEPHQKDLLTRIAADPQGWAINAEPEVQKGLGWYGRLSQFFGADAIGEVMLYHRVRGIIQDFQRDGNISGLVADAKTMRGEIITYLDREDQLLLINDDKDALKRSVQRIKEQFLMLIKKAPRYNLVRIDNEEEFPTTYAQVNEYADKAVYAWIYARSLDWAPNDGGGWTGTSAERPDPDELSLHLAMNWDGDEATDYIEFQATHPDPTRFPWKVTAS